jgi:CheY-like chemotaxis protein
MDGVAGHEQGGMDSKLILLIEDNIDDERLTLRALRRNNIMNEVVVACDGQEALDYLFGAGSFSGRDMSVMPAVVVLDLKLPRLSGLEVLKRIRDDVRTRRLPVVVLTSSEDEAQIDESYALGANSFIQKPTDPAEFSEMVLQVAMYWLLLNRTTPERMLA